MEASTEAHIVVPAGIPAAVPTAMNLRWINARTAGRIAIAPAGASHPGSRDVKPPGMNDNVKLSEAEIADLTG
jgi:hypothetical protein